MNFLDLDDLPLEREGELIDPKTMVLVEDGLRLQAFECSVEDPFVQEVQASGRKWVVLVDGAGESGLVIDAAGFLRSAVLEGTRFSPNAHCHRPIVIRDDSTRLVPLLQQLRVQPAGPEDDVVDHDRILLCSAAEKRVLTGSDLLGRLLRGVATREHAVAPA